MGCSNRAMVYKTLTLINGTGSVADETVQTGKRYNGSMLRLVSLVVACALSVTSAAGEPSRPLVGHIMALLAVFEEADVLPPEASPEANALIHALIQTQAALTKTTNPATRGWFAEALRRSEATGAEPNPREGLTSREDWARLRRSEEHTSELQSRGHL